MFALVPLRNVTPEMQSMLYDPNNGGFRTPEIAVRLTDSCKLICPNEIVKLTLDLLYSTFLETTRRYLTLQRENTVHDVKE